MSDAVLPCVLVNGFIRLSSLYNFEQPFWTFLRKDSKFFSQSKGRSWNPHGSTIFRVQPRFVQSSESPSLMPLLSESSDKYRQTDPTSCVALQLPTSNEFGQDLFTRPNHPYVSCPPMLFRHRSLTWKENAKAPFDITVNFELCCSRGALYYWLFLHVIFWRSPRHFNLVLKTFNLRKDKKKLLHPKFDGKYSRFA